MRGATGDGSYQEATRQRPDPHATPATWNGGGGKATGGGGWVAAWAGGAGLGCLLTGTGLFLGESSLN